MVYREGGVSQAKGRMKKQRDQPVPRAFGLNSENKEGVMQAKVGGTRPELDQPHVYLFFIPSAKGSLMGV